MQLLATQYVLSSLALEVYFAGCKGPHCDGCHNPESWSALGDFYRPKDLAELIAKKVKDNPTMIRSIRLLGGEPLDQDHTELLDLIRYLAELGVPIWLFTKYEIYDVPFDMRIKFSYIKTGRYIKGMPADNYIRYGVKLATTNQKLLRRGYDY